MLLRFDINTDVTVPHGMPAPRVAAIKAVRAASGFGLKEAKEFVDIAMEDGIAADTDIKLSHDDLLTLNRNLPTGFSAASSALSLSDALEAAVAAAVNSREYKVAYALIELLPPELTDDTTN